MLNKEKYVNVKVDILVICRITKKNKSMKLSQGKQEKKEKTKKAPKINHSKLIISDVFQKLH